jgi:hypothetical protein
MRNVWSLPEEYDFRYTGPDWLLILLSNASKESHPLILMLLWRAWHLRNNIIHEDGKCTVEASAIFLQNYLDTLNCVGSGESSKGKGLQASCALQDHVHRNEGHFPWWSPPEVGRLKMNVDASFIKESNDGFMGVVIRDHLGTVLCSMAQKLNKCADGEEAEALALLHGLRLCVQHGFSPEVVETDCAAVYAAVNGPAQNLSILCAVYSEIASIRGSSFLFTLSQVERECNSVAHELGKCCRV